MRGRIFLIAAALAGAISVAIDAVARHRVASDAHRLELAAIAVRYGLIHAVALIGVTLLWQRDGGFCLSFAGWLFLAGLVLFCGSLDLIAFGAPAGLAAFTPVGGIAFIAGWVALLVAALTRRA